MKLIGYFERVCNDFSIDIIEPDNMTIKAFVSGENRSKASMHREIQEYWGYRHESRDVMDAYAMAQFARCYAMPEFYTKKQQIIVSEMIRKSPARSYLREPIHG